MRSPGDVWLQREHGLLRVAVLSAGAPVNLEPAQARAMAAEIERVLWNQNHYWELAGSLRRAAEQAEALAGIDVG